MIFLLFMTTWAMVLNLIRYYTDSQAVLLAVGGAIFVLELWLIFEAAGAVRRALLGRREEVPRVPEESARVGEQ
jgi:carbon starvation protein